MAGVGLFYVGAVLIINGLMLLGLGLGSLAPVVGFVALVEGLLTAAIGAATLVLAIPVGRRLAAATPSTPPPAAPAVTTQPKESSHA